MSNREKPRLAISFSGGRSSAVMTKLCIEKYSNTHDISVTFVNTGCEHEATLEFVRDCESHFRFGTVWIEAVVTHGERVGIRHRIVDFNSASRNGEPFEEYIKKYGIPNQGSPQCTSRLKEDCMLAYRRDALGWKPGTYDTAIGIRYDEVDRMSSKRVENRLVYPLVSAKYTKQIVNQICGSWSFDLKLPGDHYGNCVWCWKKSLRKLLTLAKNSPEVFDFPMRMEQEYGHVKAKNDTGVRVFFRGVRSAKDILEMSQKPFDEYTDSPVNFDETLDIGGGCGESCEIGSDE
jgi:hypothetical protein